MNHYFYSLLCWLTGDKKVGGDHSSNCSVETILLQGREAAPHLLP